MNSESPRSILAVEDNPTNRKLLRVTLEAEGFTVREAADGVEALSVLGREKIDAIISDILMPRMDGFRLCHEVRSSERFRHIHFIIYTCTYTSPNDEKLALQMGADKYLRKPAPFKAIVAALSEVCARPRPERRQPEREPAELEVMKQYSEALVRKLTETNADLARAAEETQRQRDLLGVTLASIGDGVIVTDVQGRVTFLNREAERLTGWSSQEASGQELPAVFRTVDAETLQAVESPVEKVLRLGTVAGLANCAILIGRNGRETQIDNSGAPVRDGQGTVHGVVLVFRDCTERKRAEEALVESEARFRQLANSIPQLVFIARSDGWIFWYNDRWYDYTGTTLGQVEGWGWQGLLDPRELANVLERWTTSIATGQPFDMEVPLRGADGNFRWFLTRVMPFRDVQGKVALWFGTGTDITERREATEHLQRAKEAADAANRAKSQFLMNMSHELRTPMNSIMGMTELILAEQDLSPKARDCLQTVRESAELLSVLLSDLLDCAKIESSQLQLESAPFRLRHVLDQISHVLSARACEKGIAFSCRIPPEVPDALVGDHVRLRQVLLNLGGNGVKFTQAGEVAVTVAAASQDAEGVCLTFSVRDTGIGISPAALEGLFRPFAQADPSTTRRFGGAGLGLSIASSLVDLMGGRLSVESEQGRGSTFGFTVRLPLAKQQAAAPEGGGATPAERALRILLVEDNPANQKLAAYFLRRRGHTVDIADDGRQGVSMARQNQYDVILMDVQMPVMDGLEATRAIRAGEGDRSHVPIIAVTAHAMQEDRERCLAAGMDGYLPKPIDAEEMFAMLKRLVAEPTPRAPESVAPERAVPAASVFDPALALKRCMDSRDILDEMVRCLYEEADRLFPQITTALQAGDLVEVGRLGHRLKGTLVYLGAERATEAAQQVAHFSRRPGEKAEVEEAVKTLQRECEALKAVLAEQRKATGSSACDDPSRGAVALA